MFYFFSKGLGRADLMVLVFSKGFGRADLIVFAAEAAYSERTLKRGLRALVTFLCVQQFGNIRYNCDKKLSTQHS
jgi:hypothetical protein